MTKLGQTIKLRKVKKAKAVLSAVLPLLAVCVFLKVGAARPGAASASQEPPPEKIQKPKYDYMSGILSRSTQPLGLKEDPVIRKMLSQGAVKWALRSGSRHILD